MTPPSLNKSTSITHLCLSVWHRLRIPRPHIAQRTTPDTLTCPSKLDRQVVGRDLREQLLLDRHTTAHNIDLGDRHLVQPGLDNRPHGRKRPGCINDVKLAHALWVAILPDTGRLKDVILDADKRGNADALEVHDGARGLDGVPNRLGARGQTLGEEFFVLKDEPAELAVLGRDQVECGDVDFAETLDVDGSTVLSGG